jgi:restriction endonuclease Mrr
MAAQQAAGGYVLTSGGFTKDAIAFAKGRKIELIDGASLQKLLGTRNPQMKPNRIDQCCQKYRLRIYLPWLYF